MTRGRKPKPTEQKKLEGNPGKRGLNNQEPKPETKIPPCPSHLKGEARKEWDRVTKELLALNIISEIDRASLVAYCTAWGMYVKACGKLEKQSEVMISDEGGMYQNPWVAIRNKAMEQILKFSAEYGMTPSSRARLKVETPTEGDELEKMLMTQRTRGPKK